MSEESPFQGQPSYVEKTSNKSRFVIIFFVVLLLVIAGLGALYLLGNTAKHAQKPTNPVPVPKEIVITPTTAAATSSAQLSTMPTPTTGAALNKATLHVSVLNGSGVAGAAEKVASAIKTAGYTSVTTGNANVFTYTGLTVSVKKTASAYLPLLQKDLSSAYPNEKITASVNNTIPTDAEVVVGK